MKALNKGDIIKVPQYETPLTVTFVGDEIEMYGVEFTDETKQTNTRKSIMVNEHSGIPYLIAGTQDKGEIKHIERVNA